MTTGALAPTTIAAFKDNNGNPLALGLVYTYQAGTVTPVATYTDATLSTPNSNPIVLNFRGEAPIWLTPGQAYKFNVTDSAGNQIPGWPVDQIQGGFSLSSNLTPSVSNTYSLGTPSLSWSNLYLGPNNAPAYDTASGDIAYYARTAAEIAASITPTSYVHDPSPVYNMARYGITPNGVDNSTIIQAVFAMAKTTGGTMVFPPGDWAFYLDISGSTNKPVIIEGQGCTMRCSTNSPTQSTVIFANNSGATVSTAGSPNIPTAWVATNVEFRNCNFLGALYSGGTGTGDVNCCVAFYGASATFWRCTFTLAKVANFYGMYTQYTEFYSCSFFSATLSATSAGCLLDSHGNSSGSNEVTFFRSVFQLCSVALWMKGAIKVRLYGTNFQGNGAYTGGAGGNSIGVVIIDADATGFSCIAPTIQDAWFEVNTAPHVFENAGSAAQGVRLNRLFCNGGSGYTNAITSNYCNDWSITDCTTYATALTCTLNNPGGAAKLTFRGNNFAPVLNLASSASWDLDIHYRSAFTAALTGCTGPTTPATPTVYYTIEGDCVDLHIPSITGTSNSNACTLTGLPASIRPSSTQYGSVFLDNAGAPFAGNVDILTSGTIDFYCNGSTTGFTASGTKGVFAQVFRYPLFT